MTTESAGASSTMLNVATVTQHRRKNRGKSVLSLSSYVGAPVIALLLVSACGDQITYRDRPDFENPPEAAAGFLGYSNAATQKTTCGNCHAGKQLQWRQTAHSNAWLSARENSEWKDECATCHSVTSLGNHIAEPNVGFLSTQLDRYKDVQCESCHGPGLTHALNPDLPSTKPLAPLAVGATLTTGCGECHSGSHSPFADEWGASRHARVIVSRATNPSCIECHEAKGILAAWGINTRYAEESPAQVHMAVTCSVCHDPHGSVNTKQLRFPIDVANVGQNLCMKCHHRRSEPELSNPSPHSPQGPVLLGEAGWFPPNFQYARGQLIGSHGRSPRLCATCHVNGYEVTDALEGGFTFRSTGHSFQPIPCVNEQGIPTGVTDCDVSERSFRSCTGCHITEASVRTVRQLAKDQLERLALQIDGLIARIPASETNPNDDRISTREGANFNVRLARERGSWAHNPFLIESLLIATIQQIEIDYGITPLAAISLEPRLQPPR